MAEHDQRFDNFTQWVNKASSWLTRRGPHEKAVCLDAKNRVCRNGGDMRRARDEDAFPVRWLWPDDVAGLEAQVSKLRDGRDEWVRQSAENAEAADRYASEINRLRELLSENALRQAVHAWIAKDAPVSIKMTMTPALTQAIVNRIAH